MKEVKDKVAFVTGAASGIGLGMVRVFLAAGMKVVLADVRRDALEKAATGLDRDSGRFHLIELDVADRSAMASAVDETQSVFGKVHVLCNNAGVGGHTSIEEASYEEWDWVFGVNVGGVINGIKSFLPAIRAHGEGGHIVNTASIGGLVPVPPPLGIYAATKFAVRGISDALRLALAPTEVGVSVLCPGLVRSEIAENARRLSPVTTIGGEEIVAVQNAALAVGMDPVQVGQRVLEGIRSNNAYILTHGEFKDELRETFDEILAAFPADPGDPVRAAIENGRRQAVAALKAAIRAKN